MTGVKTARAALSGGVLPSATSLRAVFGGRQANNNETRDSL